jgi:hypothetical protein
MVNLSDFEWSEDDRLNAGALSFVMKHTSTDLVSLEIPWSTIDDQTLFNWLSKCGSRVEKLGKGISQLC